MGRSHGQTNLAGYSRTDHSTSTQAESTKPGAAIEGSGTVAASSGAAFSGGGNGRTLPGDQDKEAAIRCLRLQPELPS
jgi:hypothetical protein